MTKLNRTGIKKPHTRLNEVIHLKWEYEPLWFSVHGHVEFCIARNKLLRHYNQLSREGELIETAIAKGHIAHVYARWSCDARMECDHVMIIYPIGGHGRFPVTVVAIEVDQVFDMI